MLLSSSFVFPTAFRDLCVEIAKGELRGARFTYLLLETGVYLDEMEWDVANKLLGQSETTLSPSDLPLI